VYIARRIWKFIRVLVEYKRRHALTCKLPSFKKPESEPYLLGYGGSDYFLQGKPLSLDNIRNKLIGGWRRILEDFPEYREHGLLNFWFLNEKLSRLFPFHDMNIVVIHGIAEARYVLAAKNQYQFSKGNSYIVSKPLIGQGVLSSSGEPWAMQRAILDHGFKDDMMEASMGKISASIQNIVTKWDGFAKRSEAVNLLEESLKLTMDVLGQYAFSYEFNSVTAAKTSDAPLYDSFNTILKVLNGRCLIPPLNHIRNIPLIPINENFNASMGKLNQVVGDIVESRKAQYAKGKIPENPNDLLDVMLAGNMKETSRAHRLTSKQMVDNIKTILFAGHDTIAANLTWLLYLLTVNEEARDKVRTEYEALLGANGDVEPTYEQLEQLPYLNACVLEGLRLYPSALFTRNTLEDVHLEGHTIPKGTEVVIAPYLAHRDPKAYPDPNSFLPERWLQETGEHISLQAQFSVHGRNKTLLPFSLGPRNCVGRKLALTEIRVAVVKLLSHFDFEWVGHEDFQTDPIMWLTLNPFGIYLKPSIRTI